MRFVVKDPANRRPIHCAFDWDLAPGGVIRFRRGVADVDVDEDAAVAACEARKYPAGIEFDPDPGAMPNVPRTTSLLNTKARDADVTADDLEWLVWSEALKAGHFTSKRIKTLVKGGEIRTKTADNRTVYCAQDIARVAGDSE